MMVSWTFRYAAGICATVALLTGCEGSQPPIDVGALRAPTSNVVPQWHSQNLARSTCRQVVGKPTCLALQVMKNGIPPPCNPSGSCGFTAPQLEAAYDIVKDLGKGSGTNVAVIDAGDLADAVSDLSAYRSEYGLGTANLTKYNASGQKSNYPQSCEDYGWCLETDLDIDMVSASCPKCSIFLIETDDSVSSLETAESSAVTLGATIISNSWICGGSYDCGDPKFSKHFDTRGIAYLGASGDGYENIGAPAALDTVVAVGGTQLTQSGSAYSQTVWADSGSGCADSSEVGGSGIPKPSWQHDPDCSYRTVGDVSAEAGCSPGVAVYISLYGGWTGVCGTSVPTPFIAGVIALAGNARKMHGGKTFWELKKKMLKKGMYDITSGSNGSCGGEYLCTAGTKQFGQYSGPGGWGTPIGINDF